MSYIDFEEFKELTGATDEYKDNFDLEIFSNWFTEVMDPRKEATAAIDNVTLDQTELLLSVGQTATLTPTMISDNASNERF
ncbi:hypothetical protein [Enterococcus faecalis]|uniref:hypothetical protein n=1 Tax=Enterococcus faecalis TaxID=1351 RepID=UPI003DA162DD